MGTSEEPIQIDSATENASGEEDGSEEAEAFIMEKIVNVKWQKDQFKYRIRWLGYKAASDTWETEDIFDPEDPELTRIFLEFKEKYSEKMELLKEKGTNPVNRRSSRKKPGWEYIDLTEEPEEELAPRELGNDDEFYGHTAADIKGEVKKLFDPTHKNTSTELFLAKEQMMSSDRLTRNRVKNILSNHSSRSNSLSRDSPVPRTASASPLPPAVKTSSSDPSPSTSSAPSPSPSTPSTPSRRGRPRGSTKKTPPVTPTSSQNAEDAGLEVVAKGTPRKPTARKSKRKAVIESDNEDLNESTSNVTLPGAKAIDSDVFDSGISMSIEDVKMEMTSTSPVGNGEGLDETMETGDLDSAYDVEEERTTTPGNRLIHRNLTSDLPCPLYEDPIDWDGEALRGQRHMDWKLPKRNMTMTHDELHAIVLRCDLLALEAAMRYGFDPHLARLLHWTDPHSKQNYLHILCHRTKCEGDHRADDMLDLICTYDPEMILLRQFDKFGQLPIHIAVNQGATCRVSRLLNYRSPVTFPEKVAQGASPLVLAYRKNHAKMMRLLLQAGACFNYLETDENRKPEQQRRRRAYEVLQKHSKTVTRLTKQARLRVFIDIKELQTASPVFTCPFSEGPEFKFRFPHVPVAIESDEFTYLLFIYVASFDGADSHNWTMRCWTGLALEAAPQLNKQDMDYAQFFSYPMVFYAPLVAGHNEIRIVVGENELIRDVIAAQIVLVRRSALPPPPPPGQPWPNSGLEVAPLIGPI